MHRDENCVIPRLFNLGKGVLDAGDVGKDLDPFFGEIAQQEAGNAEEVGIAGGEDNDALFGAAQKLQHFREARQLALLAAKIGKDIEMALVADEQIGAGDDVPRLAAEPFPASDPRADQIDLFLCH